jgi:prepilin-type N-terminal cleavage/methylation domain-containing protein
MKLDSHPTSPKAAFTLIELLIVVAIIAILAAIAVPNFLEAQTRSKVSRVRADHRTIVTGLESYFVDNNKYPPTPFVTSSRGVMAVVPNQLTTPVSYLTTAGFGDPFTGKSVGDFQVPPRRNAVTGALENPLLTWSACFPSEPECNRFDPSGATDGKRYYYEAFVDGRRTTTTQGLFEQFSIPAFGLWVVASLGPDTYRDLVLGGTTPQGASGPISQADTFIPYDATNGTISIGDIVRTQKQPEGGLVVN